MIVTPTLECGGSEKYVSVLCDSIDKKRFEVILVVLNNAFPFYTIHDAAVEVISLQIKNVRHSLPAIRRLVKQHRPGIVFSTANHLNLLLAMFRWRLPKGITLLARESSLVSRNSERAPFPFWYKKLVKWFYKKLDGILCQSAAMQQDLVANFAVPLHKTIVINNPVALNVKNILQPTGTPLYIFITVARLSPEKGIDRLIRSVALLQVPFRYYIIGEGEQKEQLQQLIVQLNLQGKVILKGQQKDPYNGFAGAHLFLSGSYYEGFPNAALEAGALGIPVVAFDAPGGIGEIITEGENGLLVKDGEAGFAAAIQKALSLDIDRKKISVTTQERFSAERIIKRTEDYFSRLNNGIQAK